MGASSLTSSHAALKGVAPEESTVKCHSQKSAGNSLEKGRGKKRMSRVTVKGSRETHKHKRQASLPSNELRLFSSFWDLLTMFIVLGFFTTGAPPLEGRLLSSAPQPKDRNQGAQDAQCRSPREDSNKKA